MKEKREVIYDGMTEIREDLIMEAAELMTSGKQGERRKPCNPWWKAAVAAVLVFAVTAVGTLWPDSGRIPGSDPITAYAQVVAEPEYPQMTQYPRDEDFRDALYFDSEKYMETWEAWQEDMRAQRNQPEGYAEGLEHFFGAAMETFLGDAGTENRVYSPLNIYMALAMLAECTDGNSRGQILELLGAEDIEALRTQVRAVWNANYCQDGVTTSVLASSLWMRQDLPYVEETMERLAEVYYASSYRGEMGSEEYDQMLRDWLNEQTGGLLEDQVSAVEMNPQTILALATTIYFKAGWDSEFSKTATSQDVFHGNLGDVTCDFMHQSSYGMYYWGDRFSAVTQSFANGGAMWFFLPDEGMDVETLLTDPQIMELLLSPNDWEDWKHLTIHRSIPKFDVNSTIELQEGLKELGITDVFDPQASDFTPMVEESVEDEIFVSRAEHTARVVIDEEGCTAAAYTLLITEATGGMPPGEEIDFILDRPFLFAVTGATGQLLFVGIVNQP